MTRRAKISREELSEARSRRRAHVAMMTKLGMSAPEIAVSMHITERTVVRDRRASGCSLAKPSIPLSAAQKQRAEELFDEGCSAAEVARTIGCNPRTVLKWFPGRGWPKEQVREYISASRRFRELLRDDVVAC